MENTFASLTFKALTWHWPLIGNTESWAETVFPAEFRIGSDFIRSPCRQDSTEMLTTIFSVITGAVERARAARNKTISWLIDIDVGA